MKSLKTVISYQLSVLTAYGGEFRRATKAFGRSWWGTRDHSYLTDNCRWYCSLLKARLDIKYVSNKKYL
ncbi:hypothetical protein [Scytonema sp. PRP1]|uniref:hypothetical protein n=1 Tax=Scytonema sp. PRP1 TaxID=3120513 RepID=UPI002FD4D52A